MKYTRIIFLLLCIACTSLTLASETYTFGVVPQFDTRQIEQIWQPILEKVSIRSGITLTLKASPQIPEFEKEFENGGFHFAYMNPYHAIVANRKQGYQPILRDLDEQLVGIIVVNKDSSLTDVKQLDSKTIAMPAPNALAALVSRAEFANVFHINPNIRYVRSHDSVYLNTAMGLSDAGAGILETLNNQPLEIREQLRILYRTRSTPKHPVVAHPRVPASVIKRIQSAFLNMGKDAKDKALLAKIPAKNIGATSLKDYQVLINMGLENFYVKNK